MILKGKSGIQYNLAESPFAQGGEGQIYNINGHRDMVAKLYKQGKATSDQEQKLIKMIMSPPNQNILDQIAWPLDVLYDNGRPVGFTMHKFQLNDDLNVIYEYGTPKYPQITWGNKIHIAKNLCAVLNAVHEAGHVCGDFNPKNICVAPRTGYVTFVDTDSYHVTDGHNVYRCSVGRPEYLPPEIQTKMKNGYGLASAPLPTFSSETDNFALALHIFQLLMNGCHPFACTVIPSAASTVNPDTSHSILKGECPFLTNVPGKKIPAYAPSIDILPAEIKKMFRHAFIDGHNSPSARPSAETWYYALDRLEKNLKKCPNVTHHEYFRNLPSCPWCETDANYASVLSGGKQKRCLTQTAYPPVAAPPVATLCTATPIRSTANVGSFSSTATTATSSGSTVRGRRYSQKRRLFSAQAKARILKGTGLFVIVAVVGFAMFKVIIPSQIYNKALSLMEANRYQEALSTFKTLGNYKDAAEKTKTCKESFYQEAVTLMERGEQAKAAIAFGNLRDYKDAAKKSWTLWGDIAQRETVAAGAAHTVGLKSDGTVIAVGRITNNQCNISNWSGIIAVSAGDYHTVGLKSDGTVVAVGGNNRGQCNISSWTNIVAVSAGGYHTVGLKSDGTVAATDLKTTHGQCDVAGWTNIIAVSAGYQHTIGLESNGTIVAVGQNRDDACNVLDWTNIKIP